MEITEEMRSYGISVPSSKVDIQINNASAVFWNALDDVLSAFGETPVHSKDYEGIINWLSNNNKKGLIIMGSVGRGKTLIARFVIPLILNRCIRKTASFNSMVKLRTLKDIQEAISSKIIVLDDLGVEDVVSEYGNKIDAFSMIVDEAEKENKLLIITTNLNKSLLLSKYKDRAFDRLMSMCEVVVLKGNSLR